MTTNYYFDKEDYLKFKAAWAKAASNKNLTRAHMMLYNIIRGKDSLYGFNPYQRHSKLKGGVLNVGAYLAYDDLTRIQTWATSKSKWSTKHVEAFLAPFAGTFTIEDLINIKIPKVETFYSEFGIGRTLVDSIVSGEITVKTCIELREAAENIRQKKAKEDHERQEIQRSFGIMEVA